VRQGGETPLPSRRSIQRFATVSHIFRNARPRPPNSSRCGRDHRSIVRRDRAAALFRVIFSPTAQPPARTAPGIWSAGAVVICWRRGPYRTMWVAQALYRRRHRFRLRPGLGVLAPANTSVPTSVCADMAITTPMPPRCAGGRSGLQRDPWRLRLAASICHAALRRLAGRFELALAAQSDFSLAAGLLRPDAVLLPGAGRTPTWPARPWPAY